MDCWVCRAAISDLLGMNFASFSCSVDCFGSDTWVGAWPRSVIGRTPVQHEQRSDSDAEKMRKRSSVPQSVQAAAIDALEEEDEDIFSLPLDHRET